MVDVYWAITEDLEDQLNMGGKYNTNYIMKDIEPEYSGYYDEEDSNVYWYYGVEEGVLCEENYNNDEGEW